MAETAPQGLEARECRSMTGCLLAIVEHIHNPRTWEVGAGISGVQSHPQLHTEMKTSKGHMRLCPKEGKMKRKRKAQLLFSKRTS